MFVSIPIRGSLCMLATNLPFWKRSTFLGCQDSILGLEINLTSSSGQVFLDRMFLRRRPKNLLLHRAVESKDFGLVQSAITSVWSVDEEDEEGKTPLRKAIEVEDEAIVKLILTKADLTYRDSGGSTALHWAVSLGCLNVVETLIEYGHDLEMQDDDGRTPLHLAAIIGHEPIITTLLDNGVKYYQSTTEGYTALLLAVMYGRRRSAEMLMKHGANVNAKTESGDSALHIAAQIGDLEMVTLLLNYNANVMAVNGRGRSPGQVSRLYGHEDIETFMDAFKESQKKAARHRLNWLESHPNLGTN